MVDLTGTGRRPTGSNPSTATDDDEDGTKIMNKFERSIHKASLLKIIQGINMSEHFTQMRRTVTQSKASSPNEWCPKSEDHLKRMTAAKELTISAIIGHGSDKLNLTFF